MNRSFGLLIFALSGIAIADVLPPNSLLKRYNMSIDDLPQSRGESFEEEKPNVVFNIGDEKSRITFTFTGDAPAEPTGNTSIDNASKRDLRECLATKAAAAKKDNSFIVCD